MLLVNSLQSGKAWQECEQQKEKSHSHTNSAVSRQAYVNALLVQHLYSIFFNIWFGMVQHQKQLGCREGKKIDLNVPILQSWRRSPVEFTQIFRSILCFSSRTNCVAVRFLSLKKIHSWQNKCAAYFTFYFMIHFSKEKLPVGFIVFFSELLKTPDDLVRLCATISILKIIVDV